MQCRCEVMGVPERCVSGVREDQRRRDGCRRKTLGREHREPRLAKPELDAPGAAARESHFISWFECLVP